MSVSGTTGYIRFNPSLDLYIIKEIIYELKANNMDVDYSEWEHRIDIGDPLDIYTIDMIISTLKKFKVAKYIEDIAFNNNR